MQYKHIENVQKQKEQQVPKGELLVERESLKKLDFNKYEYDYFVEYCNFTDRQLEILNLRRKGKSYIEISLELHICETTIANEIKRIKNKILKVI